MSLMHDVWPMMRRHIRIVKCTAAYNNILTYKTHYLAILNYCFLHPPSQEAEQGWESGQGKGDMTATGAPAFLLENFTSQQEPLAPTHHTTLHQRVGWAVHSLPKVFVYSLLEFTSFETKMQKSIKNRQIKNTPCCCSYHCLLFIEVEQQIPQHNDRWQCVCHQWMFPQ